MPLRNMPEQRHRVTVHGAVDGVAFQLWVQNVASSLQLGGFVRKQQNGVCEVIVQGDRFRIRQFVATCKRGPRGVAIAKVDDERLPWERCMFEFTIVRPRARGA